MTFEEFEKEKAKGLKKAAKNCFEKASDADSAVATTTWFLEAQFYMQELDRRNDSWIAWRDSILEVVVIALIGWEIYMGYQQDTVLKQLESSASATAGTLQALQSIVAAVSVEILANPDRNTIIISNKGDTNLEIGGFKLGSQPDVFYSKPVMLIRGGSDYLVVGEFYHKLSRTLKRDGTETRIPVEIDLRTADKSEYVATCQFVVFWENGKFQYHSQTSAVNPKTWSDKARGAILTTP